MAGILLDSWALLPSPALLIGAWGFASVSPSGDPQAISAFIGSGKVEVQRTVADEPKFLDRSILLLVAVSSTSTNHGSSWRDAHGQIEVPLPGAPLNIPYGPNYGDSVELQGKVQAPFPHHSPEVLASMTFPLLSVTGSGGNPFLAALFHLRIALAIIITPSLPQPLATLLIAILLSLHTVSCNFPSESMRWCIGVMSDQGLMCSKW
jgi:competence protein ComEC